MKYSTKQGRKVYEYFVNNPKKHISADELYKKLSGSVGKATVYRQLEKLCDEGLIRKYSIGKGQSSCYQLNKEKHCETHYHLMCTECHKVIHLECDTLSSLSKHIMSEHGFLLDSSKTVLYGICSDCLEKQKKQINSEK